MYGLMIAIGLLCTFGVLFKYNKIKGLDSRFTDFIFYVGVIAIAIGFFSASVFQAFYNYLENPEEGFRLGSGITFIGGLIGGAGSFLIIYFIFRKHAHGYITEFLSIVPCCIVIAHAFGRLGCLFAGCCHGELLGKNYVFGGIYMQGDYGWGYYVPTQLYESLFLFVLFGVMTYLLFKKDFKHNMSLYLSTYGIFRFVIEFFRDDHRGELVGSISPSQFWSLLMIILSVVVYFLVNYSLNKIKKIRQSK